MKSGLALLLKALAFAAHKHRDQRRKDAQASPYINHPIALADVLVNEAGVSDIEVLCAALLHDTIEDTATTPEELEREFGREIARDRGRGDRQQDAARSARASACRSRTRRASSREAKLVKLADKICNLRDVAARPPANWDLERRREYFDWAKTVVDRPARRRSAAGSGVRRRLRAAARMRENEAMEVLLANPRGFCAGVERAIEIVERALELLGAPIYVRHEIVHNKYVVEDLRAKGAVFVEELDEVPAGATVIFSAHGVSQGGARARPSGAASRCSTPPARWSPRCTSR